MLPQTWISPEEHIIFKEGDTDGERQYAIKNVKEKEEREIDKTAFRVIKIVRYETSKNQKLPISERHVTNLRKLTCVIEDRQNLRVRRRRS